MANKISGIGNATTRINEITPEDLAVIRHYIFGFESGVIFGFTQTLNDEKTELTISQGLCFAYGYIGYEEEKKFVFNKTSAEQYHFIYGEFDLSVVPNAFELKVKNNQGGATIKPTTFRQDVLSPIRTGVYQLPLYRVKLNNTGIVEVVGIKDNKIIGQGDTIYRKYPKKVGYANITHKVTGSISGGVTATTQDKSDYSTKIATTNFVHLATRDYIDNNGGDVAYNVSITPRDYDETGHIHFSTNEIILNINNRTATFDISLDSGWGIDDYLHIAPIEISRNGNTFTVTLNSGYTPREDEGWFINFYVYEM